MCAPPSRTQYFSLRSVHTGPTHTAHPASMMRCHRADVVDADTEMVKLLDGLIGYVSTCIEFLSANAYERWGRRTNPGLAQCNAAGGS